jgi:hypothetical protein
MKFRLVPALLFGIAFSGAAQPGPPVAGEDAFPFPLIPLRETIVRGIVSWRPDWPPELPPDAFSLPANARAVDPAAAPSAAAGVRSISLSLEPELRAAWDAEGRLCEFPHFWRGAFYRTEVRYDAGGRFQGLTVSGPRVSREPLSGEIPSDGTAAGPAPEFTLELSGGDGVPFMVRSGDRFFWVVVTGGAEGMDGGAGSMDGGAEGMDGGADTACETWYDGEGNFFGLVTYRFGGAGGRIVSLEIRDRWAESYRYYSGGEMSRVESPGGVYTAVYGEKGPLYRNYTPVSTPAAGEEDTPEAVSTSAPEDSPEAAASFPSETDFQWDERGFPVLLRNRDAGGAFAGEFRYEYGTDDRGNWILRRETEMVRRQDLLVPVFRGELRRRLVCAEVEE